jgi:hypothetical protein
MASGYFKYYPVEVFTKYFGVCSKYSPVLPDKIAHREKNVSRETIAGGRYRLPYRLFVATLLHLASLPRVLIHISWCKTREESEAAVKAIRFDIM